MKKALCISMLVFTFFTASQTARAEEGVFGLSGIWFSPDTATVGSLTAMTYGVAFYYDAVHRMVTYQDNTLIIDEPWIAPDGAPLEVYYTFFSNPGSIYTHFTVHGLRIFWQIPCGRYDAFGFSLLYGDFGTTFFFGGLPWRCILPIVLTVAGTVVQAQAQQPPPCIEECKPCLTMRQTQKGNCRTQAIPCVAGALGALNTALGNCRNQAYCQEGTPTYNEELCGNCKKTAYTTFGIVGGGCAVQFISCRSNVVDCSTKRACLDEHTIDPNGCKNN